ncbi:uncharacterized mitochondrial protein AtMg00810-like [Hevea brasiliensis]|uniref:uncharacterized mitochondrial protein AtMg00810-like n=1 Tax=Hevea brasiliensis TaxID=3981 RepID=UPI0025E3AC4F|nr:uncharacterized mitochondrial protein AtMg00810-like [Hevea brasiliensis]
MLGCKPTESPIEANHKLQAGVGESMDIGRYQRLVGRLIYLSHTRLDIAYAVGLIKAFTDTDWGGSLDDRRSTSSYYTFVGGNLVTWRSKKQNVTARSSAEAEFRAMAQVTCFRCSPLQVKQNGP